MEKILSASGKIALSLCEKTLRFSVTTPAGEWQWAESYRPRIVLKDESEVFFSDAKEIKHEKYKSGVGDGIVSSYSGFECGGKAVPFAFKTLVWTENSTDNVFFELIPLNDDGLDVKFVYWPGQMAFEECRADWYSLLNMQQGLLLPNNWEKELTRIGFDGQLCTCEAYMPWFGQVRPDGGYIAICQTPWDAGYQVNHPTNGPFTHLFYRWLPSLGKMSYRRKVRYTFLAKCDYNDLCKVYREYVKETGLFTSLAEKAAKNPNVDRLIGSGFVHKGIKTMVQPTSSFFDPANPTKNNMLIKFSQREAEMRKFKEMGVEKLYLHLDGWGDPGYDNKHPDYLPACIEAGGWDGLKSLSDAMQECGYLFGLHDQYRDYYFDAETFDEEFACTYADGKIFDMARWAGGRQSYLCASQAPAYVKRNFEEVMAHGIKLQGTYLDVFTCNEPDECINPMHRMTRRECLEYRAECFDYLTSRGIVPSSEEVTDWAMKSLVFAHYGPYDFMMAQPGSPKKGIPVPLYNLVYHDCMILPWPMDKIPNEDYMLYALLNGGAAYLDKDGAYPNTDGAFDTGVEKKLADQITRWRTVSSLQERIAKCEMVRHELLSPNGRKQRTTFSNGTVVTVDFDADSYSIQN